MKNTNLIAIAAMLTLVAPAVSAGNTNDCPAKTSTECPVPVPPSQLGLMGGPGIVTSESATVEQLPEAAQKFLQTYYSRDVIGYINHNVVKDQYNVELGNGVKVTFNSKGRVEDIQAPGTDSLFLPVIKAVLPEKAYKHLEQAGLLYEVTGIKNATGKGLRVQLLNAMPPEMLFDIDGLFVIIDD